MTNLVLALQSDQEISVLASVYDLNEKEPLYSITADKWAETNLPQSTAPVNVYYSGPGQPTLSTFRNQVKKINPGIVYLNGIFSYRFVIIPLLALRRQAIKTVLCPRGMLQAGALAGKSFKKKIFIAILKASGLLKKVRWHATNAEEETDIKRIFGNGAEVIVAPNIPKKPLDSINTSSKIPGRLRLVSLSLLSEKKNLLQVIELIGELGGNISLDIYGPVKDEGYWQKCMRVIDRHPGKINYKGDVLPDKVQEVFSKYDASILLTKGENFGHALYESLSAGRPVITSFFTPWNDLQHSKAGWNLDISNNEACKKNLEQVINMNTEELDEYCKGAFELAKSYYTGATALDNYSKLFSTD